MTKKSLLLLTVLLAVGMIMVGCSSSETGTTNEEPAENEGNAAENEANTEAEGEETEGAEADGEGESASGDLNYPERDIEIIIGWGAGGGTDLFTRQVAAQLSENLGVNVNVVNMEGSSGVIAHEHYATQTEPDGYSILGISAYPLSVAYGNTPYGLDHFRGLARFQDDISSVITLADSPYNTWEKLVEAAKENPGEITIGGTGAAATDHLHSTMMMNEVGIELNYVPFESAGEMHAALLGGHIDLIFEEPGPAMEYLLNEEMVMLNVWREERLEEFPDVPTTVELGYPELTHAVGRGLVIHKDTPDEIVNFLADELKKIYDSEEYQTYQEESYLHLNEGWLGPEEYTQKLEEQIEVYKEVIETLE